jgi:hypothetical protein
MPRAPPVTIALRFFRSMAFMGTLASSLRAKRSNPASVYDLDCFVAALLAMTSN